MAGIATVLSVVGGVPLAWLLARKRFFGRELLSVVLLLPMVLPPTVLGYYLLLLVGRRSPIGRLFEDTLGQSLVFTPQAAMLAAFVSAFPFFVRAAQSGFEQIDPELEDMARVLGCPDWLMVLWVSIPLAWPGILAGLALCFARAMGEFGATIMLAGNIPGQTQTASIAIYDAVQAGRLQQANMLALVLSSVTAAALLILSRIGRLRGW